MVTTITQANEVIKECKKALEKYYGSRFKGLVLYGSTARGQASLTSDIDLLVLLGKPFDYFFELRQIIDLLYPIQLVPNLFCLALFSFYRQHEISH